MTELSAMAGSEGTPRRVSRPMGAKGTGIIFGGGVYVAENTSRVANVELPASGGQRGAERSAGLHRPLSRPGGPKLSEKAVRGLFRQDQALSIPTISHSALSLYMHS